MQICCSTHSSHFECDDHTVHIFTHWCLPVTSTEKLSLFTHAHSSPLSLAARLHRCCTNHSHYNNNGWTFSGQPPPDMCVCNYLKYVYFFAMIFLLFLVFFIVYANTVVPNFSLCLVSTSSLPSYSCQSVPCFCASDLTPIF